MQKKFTLTATGVTDVIELSPNDIMTFAAKGDQTDYTLAAEVVLVDKGLADSEFRWFPAQTIADNTLYSTNSGVRRVRFNLTDIGTATSVDIEVTSNGG